MAMWKSVECCLQLRNSMIEPEARTILPRSLVEGQAFSSFLSDINYLGNSKLDFLAIHQDDIHTHNYGPGYAHTYNGEDFDLFVDGAMIGFGGLEASYVFEGVSGYENVAKSGGWETSMEGGKRLLVEFEGDTNGYRPCWLPGGSFGTRVDYDRNYNANLSQHPGFQSTSTNLALNIGVQNYGNSTTNLEHVSGDATHMKQVTPSGYMTQDTYTGVEVKIKNRGGGIIIGH
ncbi:hypothetical protein ACFL2R_00990 [Patescibacteria group bacterium]